EKMLYDNALLVMAYLDGFQITGKTLFKRVVDETLLYIRRDMTASNGGFFSATDADSKNLKGKTDEGYYFTWTPEEIATVLGKEDVDVVINYFGVTKSGNFEKRNILYITTSTKTAAKEFGLSEELFLSTISNAKMKLYKNRNKRPAPLRDEKILTAWNGLMISAFARSGLLLKNPEYIDIAKKAATFILKNLYINKRLFRSYKDGEAKHKAYLEDYAFFIAALLDLSDADSDSIWLKSAIELDKILTDLYEDQTDGGFFMTANDHEKMICREKPGIDGAIPSGNAIAAMNLFRLAKLTGNQTYAKRGSKAISAFSSIFESNPAILPEMMMALTFLL
ncbi:thioredoxin domain-containing protein, partial [bacterium]|nr:thioredoxin domain-containing protein [bacterium]